MNIFRFLPVFGAIAAFAITEPAHALDSLTLVDPASGTRYTVTADGELPEKQKLIQLVAISTIKEKKAIVTSTETTTLRTGATQTVGQTLAALHQIFQKFLSNPVPGIKLGTLGSLDKGGTVDFVAVSPEILRLEFRAESDGVEQTDYSRADVQNFLALLTPVAG